MPDILITGHGGFDAAYKSGTYIVPPNCTVYMFANEGDCLLSGASDKIMDDLLQNYVATRNAIQTLAGANVYTEWMKMPNPFCYGTTDFRDPSGVYTCGSNNYIPAPPVADGTQKLLSELVSPRNAPRANVVYWLCCRATPDNGMVDDSADVHYGTYQGSPLACSESMMASVKPSDGHW